MKDMLGNCSFCSLACPLVFRGGERGPIFTKDSILSLDWDKSDDSKYGGSLCARGNAAVEFITHAKRINYPLVLGERSTIEAAIRETAKNLSAVKEEFGSESIGVLLGENLTNEESALALRFAHDVLETDAIALFAPDDIPLFRAYLGCGLSGLKPAGGAPSGDREVALIIGDSFSEHPCTAKLVLPGKYATRGSEVVVVSPELNHTAWFANGHLRCKPGGEAAVTAGLLKAAVDRSGATLTAPLTKLMNGLSWKEIENLGGVEQGVIEGAAGALLGAARVKTYVSNIFGRIGSPALTSVFAEAVTLVCPGESEFTPQFVQQNTWGIYSVLASAKNGSALKKLGSEELKAFVLLGLDLFSAYPAGPVEKALRGKRFTVATQLFWSQTASRANVVIPAASLMEKRGTVSPAFGEDLIRDEVLSPPGGVVTDEEFLLALSREMGKELPSGGVVRETSRQGSCEWLGEEWSRYETMMKDLDSAEIVLIPWSDPVHAADGSLSRNFNWSHVTCPEPVLMVSEELASGMNLNNGDRVSVSAEGGEVILPVKKTKKLAGKVVGATIHFPSVRKLFPWKLDEKNGEIELSPIPVRLSSQSDVS